MSRYIGKRLLQLIPILLGITILAFALMHVSSTDIVDVMENNTGGVLSEEAKAEAREKLGLDDPLPVQYLRWLGGVLTGDMGTSYSSGEPVLTEFLSRLPATLHLAVVSILLTILVSVPLGILAAVRQNHLTDYLIRLVSFVGNSLPGFFVSLLLIYFFALKLNWFPVMGNTGGWKSVILPAVTLALAMASKYIRQIRAAVLEEMNRGYVMGARARGVRENHILYRSVLKSAMLTVVTLLSLSVGSLLGGTAVVETIFMWEGVGKMAIDAITMRDYPVIQAYVIWMAVIYVVINLLTDIAYRYLDPRVRLGQEEQE